MYRINSRKEEKINLTSDVHMKKKTVNEGVWIDVFFFSIYVYVIFWFFIFFFFYLLVSACIFDDYLLKLYNVIQLSIEKKVIFNIAKKIFVIVMWKKKILFFYFLGFFFFFYLTPKQLEQFSSCQTIVIRTKIKVCWGKKTYRPYNINSSDKVNAVLEQQLLPDQPF